MEKDSRTHKSRVTCPYCNVTYDYMTNPEEYVDSSMIERCISCHEPFFLTVRLVSIKKEDMLK